MLELTALGASVVALLVNVCLDRLSQRRADAWARQDQQYLARVRLRAKAFEAIQRDRWARGSVDLSGFDS